MRLLGVCVSMKTGERKGVYRYLRRGGRGLFLYVVVGEQPNFCDDVQHGFGEP